MQTIIAQHPHCNVFEKLIQEGQQIFKETKATELTGWSKAIAKLYLPKFEKFQVGQIQLKTTEDDDPSLCIKVDIKGISYIDTFPYNSTFMFVEDIEHSTSIHPDIAMGILLSLIHPDISYKVFQTKDGAITRVTSDGGSFSIFDSRKGL
jgi:hypothetical protein